MYLSKKRSFSGEIALCYCVWYGFGRAIIEMLRTDSLMIGKIKVSCLLSFTICIAGAVILFIVKRKMKDKENESGYVEIFSGEDLTKEDENE